MRILSFKADGRVIPHTLSDIHAALRNLGHQVLVMDLRIIDPLRTCQLADMLIKYKPDLVFTMDVVGVVPAILRSVHPPPPIIEWFYDNPLDLIPSNHARITDTLHLFLWDRHYIQPVQQRGFKQVYYQPFGTNTHRHHPPAQHGDYLYDTSFVGGYSPARAAGLEDIAAHGHTIHVFGGADWKTACRGNMVYAGNATNDKDCPRIYAQSRINLNITSTQLISALPVRVYDVMACGGFMLTDDQDDVHQLFQPGKELVVYRDAQQAAQAITYYLEHEAERLAICEAGRKRVIENYSFERILPVILEQVKRDYAPPANPPGGGWTRNELLASWLLCASCLRLGDLSNAQAYTQRLLSHASPDELILSIACLCAAAGGNILQTEEYILRLQQNSDYWEKTKIDAIRRTLRGEPYDHWEMLYKRFFTLSQSTFF